MILSCLVYSHEFGKESLLGTFYVVLSSVTCLLSSHTCVYFCHHLSDVQCFAALLHLTDTRSMVILIFAFFSDLGLSLHRYLLVIEFEFLK